MLCGIFYSIYSRFLNRIIFGTERNLYNNLAFIYQELETYHDKPINVTGLDSVLAKIFFFIQLKFNSIFYFLQCKVDEKVTY